MLDINVAKKEPDMWMYERRYTNVRHMAADMYTATITLPNHSGLPPGFLHLHKCNTLEKTSLIASGCSYIISFTKEK